jgi:hypothetical protein
MATVFTSLICYSLSIVCLFFFFAAFSHIFENMIIIIFKQKGGKGMVGHASHERFIHEQYLP